ncbi:MAG: NADH-quinone oxidoreductase subunit H [Rubrivivax sp.]|nr:MAG: NADH-quinone oxidoreductase subunit H [Rubrivivax sp.]
MEKFIGEYYWLIFALIKCAIMLGFFINAGGLLTIVERRQAAIMQDRVGPNRALVKVPGIALKALMSGPPLLAALAVVAVSFLLFPPTVVQVEGAPNGVLTGVARGFWLMQIGLFMLWSHLLMLGSYVRREAGRAANGLEQWLVDLEDPRWIFYTGAAAHVAAGALYGAAGTPAVGKLFAYAGPLVLAGVLAAIGGYAGYRIPSGPVGLRLGGVLHPAADGLKFAFKEDFVPPAADKMLHALAPILSLFPALVVFAIIPFGDDLCFGTTANGYIDLLKPALELGRDGVCNGIAVPLQIADLNVGILYLFAMAGTGIVGAAIAGWSSDNKWSLLGGLRAASQMVSYEVAMGLSLAGAFMIYGTPRLNEMVRWQSQNTWGIFVQPVAFFLFFAASLAEQKRAPFDSPEGESEIVAGYLVEYSSFKFAMFYTAEYIEAAITSALLTSIFLGGWSMPFLHPDGITLTFGGAVLFKAPMTHLGVTILQVLCFYAKVIVLSMMHIFIRWTVLRFRYDQIMAFGWKFLLPAAIGNLVLTGMLVLVADQGGESVAAALRMLADACNAVIVLTLGFLAVRFMMLVLSPVERKRFIKSTSAAQTALLGGTKSGAMQA